VPRTGSDKVFKRGLAERLAPLLALVGADDTR
jgi:hypothetical protein